LSKLLTNMHKPSFMFITCVMSVLCISLQVKRYHLWLKDEAVIALDLTAAASQTISHDFIRLCL